ncbi:MAG: flagellar biosynthetic protein FliR [Chlamydiae bacterium]|nr:flagellar biosynthetic protein FliR [Chlamydiota bacterium]
MTSDYLLYFFNIPGLSPTALAGLFLLTLLRVGPIIGLAPFLGGRVTPVSTRIGFAVILTFVFLPMVLSKAHHVELINFNWKFSLLAVKELFLGFVLGFFVAIPFFIAQSSGILIDSMRGSSAMQAQDPTMQNQSSSIGNLFNYILIVLFFQIDGPFIFFDAFLKSYEVVPPDAFLSTKFFALQMPLWTTGLSIMSHIIALCVQLAAPALIAVLMTEVFLGIANRLAPQVQISFLGMSLKSLVGLLILWAGWFFILKQTSLESLRWLNVFDKILYSWHP